jgi:hypothetical protein
MPLRLLKKNYQYVKSIRDVHSNYDVEGLKIKNKKSV